MSQLRVNSGTITTCSSSEKSKSYWRSSSLAVCFLCSESGSFSGLGWQVQSRWNWKASRGPSVPTELHSGLISHLSGNSFPSDRLIGVWVVTKKESILLAVCLAKWNRFLKLYQNVIVLGFDYVPSDLEGRSADPAGQQLSCQGLTQVLGGWAWMWLPSLRLSECSGGH